MRGGEKLPVNHRKGFTLVEVIVVLVILAILAAIAIPALTGYIDKAEDRKYIADTRNDYMSFRTLLAEDYSTGKFTGPDANSDVKTWFLNGTAGAYGGGVWDLSSSGGTGYR
jgi:prepilin-type N-terminal cleavage/methylation domain-containing protein